MSKLIKDKIVYFDNQIFVTQKFGGISRYFVDLFKEFDSISLVYKLIGIFNKNIYLNSYSKEKYFDISAIKFKGDYIIVNFFNRLYYLFFNCLNQKSKIIHHTYYDPKFLNNKKHFHILTIYDMIHEIFEYDESFSKIKKKCIEKADILICISNSTSDDLVKYYNIPKEKIRVIYLSSSLSISNLSTNLNLPKKYILFVGLRDRYKNFDLFISAILKLLIFDKDLKIICAGGGEFNNNELDYYKSLQILDQIIFTKIENDNQLATIYNKAMFFVFPSKYEGFGIPILEAFNCDCPVVLSNTSSLVEIADYAGHYFDPESKDSIYNACKEVYESELLRIELINKGRKRRIDFSAKYTAEKTIAVYNEIISNV